MQCQHAREIFSDYVAEALDNALVISLENHLAACAACREEVAGLRRVWAALDQAPLVEPPAFFHENILSRIEAAQAEAEEAAARRRARWDWRALLRPRSLALGAAAAILLLACVEVVQESRSASLGPLGLIAQWLHPAPPAAPVRLQATVVGFVPRPEGGGTLELRLRAEGASDSNGAITYHAQAAGARDSVAEGALAIGSETPVNLTLPAAPSGDSLRLEMKLTAADGRTVASIPAALTIPLPQTLVTPPTVPNTVAPQTQTP